MGTRFLIENKVGKNVAFEITNMRLAKDLIYSYLESSQGIKKVSGELIVGLDVFKHLGIQDDLLSCIKMNNMLLYKTNYDEFLRLTKPTKPPQPQFDQIIMVERVRNKLQKLGVTDEIIKFIMSLDGCISGSTVLSAILDEDWGNDSVDVYVNRNMLLGLFDNGKYPKNTEGLYKEFSKVLKDFGFKVTEENVKSFSDNSTIYTHCEKLLKTTRGDLSMNFFLLKCTPKLFIDSFDFAFNSVYYDGFTVNIMDIDSVKTRRCMNEMNTSGTDDEKFKKNWNRIKKYMERGFVILLNSTEDDFLVPTHTVADMVDIKNVKPYKIPEKEQIQLDDESTEESSSQESGEDLEDLNEGSIDWEDDDLYDTDEDTEQSQSPSNNSDSDEEVESSEEEQILKPVEKKTVKKPRGRPKKK